MMQSTLRKYTPVLLLAVLVLMFIPFLGASLFNTKGEPREAIVAMSMLDTGNWVLPVSFGQEIPYKPPFLAWCIAAVSWLFGGITEMTSRLPSAIAAIALAMLTYRFFSRRCASQAIGVLTALVMVTSIEVWRAAWACRVDMVLTVCMVGAIYVLADWFDGGRRRLPWMAVVLMTCAFLTKGPVGVLLPCMVVGVYRLIRGDRFWGLFWRLGVCGICSCIVPALWYYAAYQQGGDQFLSLVIEENFGRISGTMSYESHVNPWWYNVLTVTVGMLPYTLLALAALWLVHYRSIKLTAPFGRLWQRVRAMDDATLLALVTTVVIFVFYCIPKSKRSVYLLPIYPFLAYFVTLLIRYMTANAPRMLRAFMGFIAGAAVVVGVAAIPFVTRLIPKLHYQLSPVLTVAAVVVSVVCVATGVVALRSLRREPSTMVGRGMAALVMLYVCVMAAVLPPILSSKSMLPVARDLEARIPKGEIYSYNAEYLLRHYEINYYMRDRLRIFDIELPQSGKLIVTERDLDTLHDLYDATYVFAPVDTFYHPALLKEKPAKRTIHLLDFTRR